MIFDIDTLNAMKAKREQVIASRQKPCKRCSGTGLYGHHGRCFRCGGTGEEPKKAK